MTDQSKTVLGILTDLFFRVKIEDAVKRSGLVAAFATTEEAALEHVRKERPLVVVVDLNCAAVDPIRLVAELKGSHGAALPVIGFISHVEAERRMEAQNAGYDTVLPRSAFSSNLPQLLRGYSES
jgi:DNA-binding NarL/FixJ family response regulator